MPSVEYHAKKLREASDMYEAQPHLDALRDKGTAKAVNALAKHGLSHKGIEVVQLAVRALWQIKTEKAAEALIRQGVLASKDVNVGRELSTAFHEFGKTAVKPLIKYGITHKNHEVVKSSIWQLGKLKDERAVRALAKALKHKDPEVARQSAYYLGVIKDKRAVPALIEALKHKKAEVVESSACALGEIGDEEALPHLMMRVDHPDGDVRSMVKSAIRKIQEAKGA
jgi:HEAT repeat protein